MKILPIILFKIVFASVNVNWYSYLSDNSIELKAISKNIESLNGIEIFKQLKSIDLSLNKIKLINQLEHLSSLESLILSNNQIKQINSLHNLTSLQLLYLANNQIKEY